MCAEPRDGTLYIFMPPGRPARALPRTGGGHRGHRGRAGHARGARGLRAAERPAPEQLPRHARSRRHRGEHPSLGSWDDLVDRTTHLYDAARQSRLTTEKFMLDGRHTGTGGGNHFVLGGATPADSPFLRRPDLLRSLLAYWHNHPVAVLSVLRPVHRPDLAGAARRRSAQRLAVRAGAGVQAAAAARITAAPPWLVDRLFRNLLIDSTGNTHRAEFCIDKMFSPDSNTGRLGLLEMRAFEMPPHERMSLTQQLLLRSLIARFWREPYQPARLARWGTELHDRFMLPYFIEQDLADVLTEQNQAGFPLKPDWFAPHREFRFPKFGDFAALRHRGRAAPGVGTLACHGRGGRGGRRRALRGFLGRAAAGEGVRARAGPLRAHLQWPAHARCGPRARWASSSPACATRPGSRRRRCIR